MTGRDGKYNLSRRDGTLHKKCHDGTGRYIFCCSTGRDGAYNFHDGTGRYIISSTTGGDGTFFFFFDGTSGTFF